MCSISGPPLQAALLILKFGHFVKKTFLEIIDKNGADCH
jgi:hypothetical protein